MGERITVLKRDGNWWTGKIGDRTGTFPNNYVQKIDNVNFENNKNCFFLFYFLKPLQEAAIAIAPFHTKDEGRLSFDKGQMIFIRKKGDKGWYQGEVRV